MLIPNLRLDPRRLLHSANKLFSFATVFPAPMLRRRSSERASPAPFVYGEYGQYRIRLAMSDEDRSLACRLRFKVFNLELGEGLKSSYSSGLDQDRFDCICDHLLVEHKVNHRIVGTYRMQSGITAARNRGYYSAREFDFSPYRHLRRQTLELGRASIDREHRGSEVLTLLWRGIAQYARLYNLRYLIGCSSLTSHDPAAGWSMFQQLSACMVEPGLETLPTPAFALPPQNHAADVQIKVPKLLRTYIGVGARICGPPAWDREFGTIDLLTLLDLQQITPAARKRFLSSGTQ